MIAVVALVPAHNEEEAIANTILSLQRQTLQLRQIIVCADNCTDDTVEIASSLGVRVMETVNNKARKAGALNQGLALCFQLYPDVEYILQMDADTAISEQFVEKTVHSMLSQARVGGLCSSYIGRYKKAETLFGQFLVWGQRVEFIRFSDGQLMQQVQVLSGTASLFRVTALRGLLNAYGYVWHESLIVEDYVTTKNLQRLGWKTMTHPEFKAYTDVMTTWKSLLKQRMRWQLGTLEVVFGEFRGDKTVRLDAWRLRYVYLMMIPHVLGYGVFAASILLFGFHPTMLIGFFIVALYEAWPVRKIGWLSFFMTLILIPVEVYNGLRYIWMIKCLRLYRKGISLKDW